MIERISVRGARQHNLKNISLEIPRNQLTVVTGLSGSGKSSLAFDILYAEGQRRYVETLSAYARQFLDQMERPDVDAVEGLSPAIAIEQKTTHRGPRSTVGTITEIYDYLRLLYASIAVPHCPRCKKAISRQSTQQIVQTVMTLRTEGQSNDTAPRIMVLAPVVRGRKGEFRKLFEQLAQEGFVRVRVDGTLRPLDEEIHLERRRNHTIEVVVDRLLLKPDVERRLAASIDTATKLAKGTVQIAVVEGEERLYSQVGACLTCGLSLPVLEPRSFSFNSPYGACPACRGLGHTMDFDPAKIIVDRSRPLFAGGLGPGSNSTFLKRELTRVSQQYQFDLATAFNRLPRKIQNLVLYGKEPGKRLRGTGFPGLVPYLRKEYQETRSENILEWLERYMSAAACPECRGQRLRRESLAAKVGGLSIADVTALPVTRCAEFIRNIQLTPRERTLAGRILSEISDRLTFLETVGLDYLSLDRTASTLSSGESQRIRLATQIGSRLRGVLYVLDEPSIGLHPRDNERLLNALERLRDLGNTVLIVEHDEETIRRADYVVDLGPGAGRQGGHLVAQGTPLSVMRSSESLTGQYLLGNLKIPVPPERRVPNRKKLSVLGARANNLKNIDVHFPVGLLTVVTGVSGSGKSTLIHDILYRSLAKHLYRALAEPGPRKGLRGAEHIDKVVVIDQSPIGRTPRSNPATYTGVFTPIRELLALLPESRARGYRAGRFSFNVKGGRCETCRGAGLRRIEMNFLPDVFVSCEVCRSSRYNSETLAVRYKGYSVAELLASTVQDLLPVFENIPQIRTKLQTLVDVGLGYLHLGQPATTLSGGEAQRIKLSRELSRRQTGRTLYVLDEPTTGLHFHDVRKLLEVLNRLTDLGNTVIIIEHHLDVIKQADWIIDLGPEGGEQGGRIVAQGRPDEVARVNHSYTGQALAKVLNGFATPIAAKPARRTRPGNRRGSRTAGKSHGL